MKKKLSIVVAAFVLFSVWLVCYCIVNYEPLASGTSGKGTTGVRYHVATSSGVVTTHFRILGNVQLIRFTPVSNYPDSDGFVNLKIKTSNGWYESPVCRFGGSVDWKKGIEVVFEYPKEKVLRERTADDVYIKSRYLGVVSVTKFERRNTPLHGDIAKVCLRRGNYDKLDFSIEHTTGLVNHGRGGKLVGKVEILISPK